MTVHYQAEDVTVHHGDCLDVLAEMPDNSVDAVVTDPPYGLEFMGKEWDSFKTYAGGNPNLKPNGATISATPDGEWQPGRTYGGRNKNPRCRRCGKLQRGNGSCKCPEPQWDTRTSESAFQFQAWTQDWAEQAWRVLKPGGHLLAFGGTRTWHRLAVAIEDAGFEMRDSIAWLYGSGFPKSLDVSKAIDKGDGYWRGRAGVIESGNQAMSGGNYERTAKGEPVTDAARQWQGWGTALKPAFEPVVVARKPLQGTVSANVQRWGTGALNIDATRIEGEVPQVTQGLSRDPSSWEPRSERRLSNPHAAGRWPANVVLDEFSAAALDQQSGTLTSGNLLPGHKRGVGVSGYRNAGGEITGTYGGDSGGASRFFYTAKAGAEERPNGDGIAHPTVKPLDLMCWLVRLVTPRGGLVLDPFAGSGTTLEAALREGFRCVGVEREAEYLPLIVARVSRPINYTFDFGAEGVPADPEPVGGYEHPTLFEEDAV